MKKLKKDINKFTGASLSLGIGTGIVAGAGGNTAGLAAMGGMMPVVGTATMGGHALRMIKPKKKRRRR